MKFYTIVKKLQRMGIGEIAGRVAGELRIKRLLMAAGSPDRLISQFKIGGREVVDRCVAIVPGTSAGERSRLEKEFPNYFALLRDGAYRRAECIAAGEYELLGKQVSITPSMDWHTDPSTGYTWSKDFFGRVSYHKIPKHVDFKDIWELGRQQYVVELSRSWLMTGDTSHAELARDMILSWIDGNPFCHGIHWTSGLEVGVRAISWIWALANLHDFSGWRSGEQERIVESLGLHAYYLENHFSFYSSPYNHIIGEAAGLYLIATVLRGSTHATRWQRVACRVLMEYGSKQFYDDGFCVEQAMGYHYFTSGFMLLAQMAANHVDDTSLQLEELLRRALRAGLPFRQPDGNWPMIGDVDSAQSIPVARENYWDFSATHELAAAAFDDPTVACNLSADESESSDHDLSQFGELFWILGCDGMQARQQMQVKKNSLTMLPDAGYYVASDDRDFMLMDAGPISAGLHHDASPSAAHGHADTLQVLYQLNGRAILCDAGMPNYAGDLARADYFRSPQSHNTVTMEGADLVRPAGGLAWTHEVRTPTLKTFPSENGAWVARGEVIWPNCRIARHVLAVPGEGLWIADWLQSNEPRVATWHWQFPEEIEPKLHSSEKLIQGKGQGVSIQSAGLKDLYGGKIVSRDANGFAGWVSPGYGVTSPAHRLTYHGKVDGNLLVLTCVGDTNLEIGFEIDGQKVTLANDGSQNIATRQPLSRDENRRWQRRENVGSGYWLVRSNNDE